MNATSLTLAQDAPAESSPADRAESAAERPALRVALYTDADVFAGTERHMIDLARGLREEGADISVLCPSPSPLAERAAREHIRVVAIPKRGKIDFGAIRVIRRMLKRREIDIVHSHNGRTALAASIAAALAKRGVCVTTQHFLRPNRTTARGMRAVLSRMMHRWLSRHTGYFIAISSAVMQEMLARRDAPAAKISVVPNGMIEPVSTDLATSLAVRKSLGIASDDPLVVCVARLEKEKDIGTLIGAMKRIIAKRSNAHCVIAGEGTYRLPLEKQIAAENLQGAVHLLGFCKDTLSLIRAGDVFVLPSAAEPFGLVLLEAMWLA
ncbi:MAG: glycosyltransferase, partial [Tepidisphaeraceae bacterium]